MHLFKAKEKTIEDELCTGVLIKNHMDLAGDGENRIYTLLLKGILVFFIVMGSMGIYLEAVDAIYNQVLLVFLMLIFSLFCALMLYSKRTENMGYILLLFGLSYTGISGAKVINSGFYAVINHTLEKASDYFNLPATRYYSEFIDDRYFTITFAMAYIGLFVIIILNIWISKRMNYFDTLVVSIVLLVIPVYLELKINIFYYIMYISGVLLSFVWQHNGAWDIKYDNKKYIFRNFPFKRSYNIHYDCKAVLQALLVLVMCVIVSFSFARLAVPDTYYEIKNNSNSFKQKWDGPVSNVAANGLAGIFNKYSSVGGVNHGKLGGVNNVSLDYETDLVVTFAPYTTKRMYLSSYVAGTYQPYTNRWQGTTTDMLVYQNEISAMEKAFSDNEITAAKGYMIIEDVNNTGEEYKPYYSTVGRTLAHFGNITEGEYYPYFEESVVKVDGGGVDIEYLMVPDENAEVIKNLIREQDFHGDEKEVTEQIKNYFQENIPYTYNPGITPKNEDFVNYFLTVSKKGICVHFASAAVLIYRSLGIPARYVEGYVIDYKRVLEGTLVEDSLYDSYYSGYTHLGETGVVRVELPDAAAHAWVEVYTEELGWHPVEVTPASTEEAEAGRNSFWETFFGIFGNVGQTGNVQSTPNADNNTKGDTSIFFDGLEKAFAYIVIGVIILAVLVFGGFKTFLFIKVQRMSLNDRLIYKYSKVVKFKAIRNLKLKEQLRYKDQLKCIAEYGAKKQKLDDNQLENLVTILNKAGFSNKAITKEEYDSARRMIKLL